MGAIDIDKEIPYNMFQFNKIFILDNKKNEQQVNGPNYIKGHLINLEQTPFLSNNLDLTNAKLVDIISQLMKYTTNKKIYDKNPEVISKLTGFLAKLVNLSFKDQNINDLTINPIELTSIKTIELIDLIELIQSTIEQGMSNYTDAATVKLIKNINTIEKSDLTDDIVIPFLNKYPSFVEAFECHAQELIKLSQSEIQNPDELKRTWIARGWDSKHILIIIEFLKIMAAKYSHNFSRISINKSKNLLKKDLPNSVAKPLADFSGFYPESFAQTAATTELSWGSFCRILEILTQFHKYHYHGDKSLEDIALVHCIYFPQSSGPILIPKDIYFVVEHRDKFEQFNSKQKLVLISNCISFYWGWRILKRYATEGPPPK